MPEFATPFSGTKHDRKLTHGEIARAVRFMVAAEEEIEKMGKERIKGSGGNK